jgi:hypothetical protein
MIKKYRKVHEGVIRVLANMVLSGWNAKPKPKTKLEKKVDEMNEDFFRNLK